MEGRTADAKDGRGVDLGGRGTGLPDELDELLLEITDQGDDGLEVVSPYDKDRLITLERCKIAMIWRIEGRTMNAPRCSLSASGRRVMESRTWIRVLLST